MANTAGLRQPGKPRASAGARAPAAVTLRCQCRSSGACRGDAEGLLSPWTRTSFSLCCPGSI